MSAVALKSRGANVAHNPSCRNIYVDQGRSGFLAWAPLTKAYKAIPEGPPPLSWESESQLALDAIQSVVDHDDYFDKLAVLWGQESGRSTESPELRSDNFLYIKVLGSSFLLTIREAKN